jgi:MFS family permease
MPLIMQRHRKVSNMALSKGFEYSRHGWKVLAALWVILLLVVAVPSVGASVVNAAMISDLKMNRAIFGLGFGIFVLMMGVEGPLVAALVSRCGYRTTVTIGGTIMFGGSLAMATIVTTGWQFALAFGVLVGSGVCIAGMLPAQTVVTKWFTARRAFAISVVLSSIEIGGLVSPPGLERLLAISNNNWRIGWWLIAVLAILAVITARYVVDDRHVAQLIANSPTSAPTPGSARVFKTTARWSLKEAARTRGYWSILVYMSAVGIGWVFLMAHGTVHLRDLGHTPGDVALAVALTVAASFAGNMTAGALGDRISPSLIAAVSGGLMAIGFFMVVAPHGFEGIVLYTLPIGFGYGASQVCISALLGNYFGRDAFSTMLGSMLPVATFLAAAGTALAGAIYESQGSYTAMCNIVIMLCLVASLTILTASPQMQKEDREPAEPVAPESERLLQ